MFRDGAKIEELQEPVVLTVKTRCPSKWRLIDIENGRVFIGNSVGTWIEMSEVTDA